MEYDVFNGDADGICALHQLRLQEPRPDAALVTGVKRDIKLLDKICDVRNSKVTVLDISLDSNRASLTRLLAQNNQITYIDHHFAGDIPATEQLISHIDTTPTICTALIVDRLLKGKYRGWAIAAAFGDNFHESARQAGKEISLSENELSSLQELGELLNYNGYGAEISDLHFSPDILYAALKPYSDPFDFLSTSQDLHTLRAGYEEDMTLAMEQKVLEPTKNNRVYSFPNAPWARRVSGVFSNLKAREKETAAHALIVENDDATLRISVRAPLSRREHADTLCRSFPTGGGRSAAAGINNLPPEMLDDFLKRFHTTFTT